MAQNYGLGRGLSSLIPQKKRDNQSGYSGSSAAGSDGKLTGPKDDFNYFGSARSAGPQPRRKADAEEMPEKGNIQEIEISRIVPNPYQPRVRFDETKLYELAESIKAHGIIQPLIVSQKDGGQFEIIAGERRFQAAKIAGLKKIPAIIRKADNRQKLELAVVENIQRHDLNPIEEAKSYQKMADEFDMSQDEIAKKLGVSRSSVANKLRLLTLPVEIQKSLIEGKITEGHAKAILAVSNPEKQRVLYDLILKNGLTVRQVESKAKEVSVKPHKRIVQADPETKQIEDRLAQVLGTKVKLAKAGSGGKIVIEYYSKEELNNILRHIKLAG